MMMIERLQAFRYFTTLSLFYLLTIFLLIHSTHSRCLNNLKDLNTTKRHLYYSGLSLPLLIETTERTSHQLLSRILRIILLEEVDHASVQLVQGVSGTDPRAALERLSARSEGLIPESMINLELWVPAGFNMETWSSSGQVVSGGPLGPFGRFGWYVPSSTVETKWGDSGLILDHWKTLKMRDIAREFSLPESRQILRESLTKVEGERGSLCDRISDNCVDGFLQTTQCTNNDRCALLLLGHPVLGEAERLQLFIDHLGLYVNPVWIGSHLNSFIESRAARNLSTLFFNWLPNDLTSSGRYSRIHFPSCHSSYGRGEGRGECDYEVNQLTKMMWSTIRTHAPETYHVVSHMTFSQEDLDQLLKDHTEASSQSLSDLESSLETTACQWVRNNEDKWKKWLPEGLTSKQRIYLGGMFPLSGPYWRQPAIVEGAEMAVEYINENDSILPDHELVLFVRDTQCKVDVTMKHFVEYISNTTHPIVGILGPGCSETAEPIAGVSKHFHTIVISYSAEAVQLANRATYPLFFRTIPHILQNGDIYIGLFKLWDWQQVALLCEDGQNYPAFHGYLKDLFISHSIQVVYDRKMPRQAKHEDASKYMDELKRSGAKIVILTTFEQAGTTVICEAYKKGMTAREGYVWFLPTWFTSAWWDTNKSNSYFTDKVQCTTEQMLEAAEGYFSLNTAFLGPVDSAIVGKSTVKGWFEEYYNRIDKRHLEFSPYGSYAYDAVLVFALGLHKLLAAEPSALESLRKPSTVEKYMSYLNKTSFSGASGPVQFVGADRMGIITIDQFNGIEPMRVGEFIPDKNVSERLYVRTDLVKWYNGVIPSDGRPPPKTCSIEGIRRLLGVECDVAVIVVNVIGISVFVIIMIILLILVKRRYDAKVKATRLRMEELGLLPQDISMFCLDEWEVQREHVVLNRKLGEGAFGTVYGGEVFLADTWVAVAVKTLKIGSTVEDKLDFLSEVEMMKRFDHKNIVKLLGVCTRGEPAYTIMEFMLHGDLKTFLLSRRQLVNEISRESEDISPQGLTQMALDVARGLKYLSSLKYVHRDLACRNCLVHAEKTVKIGDFGMTRPMYDNDYYKFNKRGMFPVRWMAPESLTDGIFGTFSDIWSYGVLLYEIMTFGSFPYQGLSNRQVLNYVKAGNTIVIPSTCPSKVRMLLEQCWTYDSKDRPNVDDIIAVLDEQPGFIVPCLDTPSSAVAREGTDSLEMSIVPRIRHKNQYQKTTSGAITRRGLSLSSHEEELKNCGFVAGTVDGECSPLSVFPVTDHPLSLLNFSTPRTSDHDVAHDGGRSGEVSPKANGCVVIPRSVSVEEKCPDCSGLSASEAVNRITSRYSSTQSTNKPQNVIVSYSKSGVKQLSLDERTDNHVSNGVGYKGLTKQRHSDGESVQNATRHSIGASHAPNV